MADALIGSFATFAGYYLLDITIGLVGLFPVAVFGFEIWNRPVVFGWLFDPVFDANRPWLIWVGSVFIWLFPLIDLFIDNLGIFDVFVVFVILTILSYPNKELMFWVYCLAFLGKLLNGIGTGWLNTYISSPFCIFDCLFSWV